MYVWVSAANIKTWQAWKAALEPPKCKSNSSSVNLLAQTPARLLLDLIWSILREGKMFIVFCLESSCYSPGKRLQTFVTFYFVFFQNCLRLNAIGAVSFPVQVFHALCEIKAKWIFLHYVIWGKQMCRQVENNYGGKKTPGCKQSSIFSWPEKSCDTLSETQPSGNLPSAAAAAEPGEETTRSGRETSSAH